MTSSAHEVYGTHDCRFGVAQNSLCTKERQKEQGGTCNDCPVRLKMAVARANAFDEALEDIKAAELAMLTARHRADALIEAWNHEEDPCFQVLRERKEAHGCTPTKAEFAEIVTKVKAHAYDLLSEYNKI